MIFTFIITFETVLCGVLLLQYLFYFVDLTPPDKYANTMRWIQKVADDSWSSRFCHQRFPSCEKILKRNTNMKSLIFLIVCATVAVESRRQVKEYVIDLDKAPEERYLELLPQFNDTVRKRLAHFRLAHFRDVNTKNRSGDFGINTLQRMLF